MATPLKSSRTQAILELLSESGRVSLKELTDKLAASEMTLRRDLKDLEARGLARRVHGGAVLASDRDPGYWLRFKQFQKEKRSIGVAAAQSIEAGQSVYLDTGTTAIEVARALVRRSLEENLKVRVTTHAINVGAELAGQPNITLHQIGGEIYPDTFGATGPAALQQIASLNFDVFLLGVSGADPAAGWTASSPVGVEIKQAVLERARRVCAIGDSSKWEKVCFASITPLDAVDAWITDARLDASVCDALGARGVRVTRAADLPS
jgi:DeoR/GlpR family transcriptional regulator of sugar metabolism